MSPEAVEALAKSLAAKMEFQKGAVGELTDQLMAFQASDQKFKEGDADFKREVRAALATMRTIRHDVPLIAVGLSLVSIIFAAIALVGSARAAERMGTEVRDIREHMAGAIDGGRSQTAN